LHLVAQPALNLLIARGGWPGPTRQGLSAIGQERIGNPGNAAAVRSISPAIETHKWARLAHGYEPLVNLC
jgi:hypothetical protein